MTDAEIEAIARLYCRKLGLDPDEDTWGYDYDREEDRFMPEWFWRRQTVREALAMQEAIAEVRATVAEGGGA